MSKSWNADTILYLESNNNLLNLSIARFCPNLKSLFTMFDEIETLKEVLNSCKYLESIKVGYQKGILEVIANHSPNNLLKLALEIYDSKIVLKELKELESFFISWGNPQKSILLFMIDINISEEITKIIKKYKKNFKQLEIKKPDKEELANYSL